MQSGLFLIYRAIAVVSNKNYSLKYKWTLKIEANRPGMASNNYSQL